jgi:hypothetical protein
MVTGESGAAGHERYYRTEKHSARFYGRAYGWKKILLSAEEGGRLIYVTMANQ